MHMADALISPGVGSTMWAASAGAIWYSSKKVKNDLNDSRIPLMGVFGAFVFAAQMINFTIPGTGASGHLVGAMILSIVLGPCAAFLTMASILVIQALFFADGGILALGCNMINMGVFPCFVAYPLIYRGITRRNITRSGILTGSIVASAVGLQLGALGVVLQTVLSGIAELPFGTFLLLMLPIHLAIGIVEGLVTFSVIMFVQQARPEAIEQKPLSAPLAPVVGKKTLAAVFVAAAIIAGVLSWFASRNPDGLEWAVFHTSGSEELAAPDTALHPAFAELQDQTSFLPDYDFKAEAAESDDNHPQSVASAGTTVSGLVGGGLTLALSAFVGWMLKRRSKPS